MKKLFLILLCICTVNNIVYSETVYDDNYEESPNYIQGSKYLASSQYSSAINEFKKAIRINPQDTSSLIGLSNAYNLRAEYYNNTVKATDKAISDLKSALFFIKYYPDTNVVTSQSTISLIEKNLSTLQNAVEPNRSADNIFAQAKKYRVQGEFAAAGYDYYNLLNNQKYSAIANSSIADIYKIFSKPNKAIEFYRKSLSISPNNTDVHLNLARTYEQINDYSGSLKEYTYALNTSNEKEEILNSLEKIWQKKVDENPNDAENHANLGVIYQKEKRYSEALNEYKKAEQLNPANINTKINIATLYQEQKRYSDSINTYNSILQMQPQNINVLTYKAECLKALNKNDEAVSLYKSILNLSPNNAQVKASLFDLMKDTMPQDKVLDFLYKNVQNSPMNAEAYYEFAYELHKANKIDDAITYYIQTIKMDKNNIDAYINLSQAYRQKQNYNEAYNVIKQAKEIAPQNELVLKQYDIVEKEIDSNNYSLASNSFQSGDYKKAIDSYMKINPPTLDSLIGIAASYQALEDNAQAITYYKKAMELDSKNPDIPFYIASLYAYSDDFENAQIYIDNALKNNPNHAKTKELVKYISEKNMETMIAEGINLFDSGKYNESITKFSNAIQVSSNNPTLYYYRAMAYDELKEYQKAISDYKMALKYDPEMYIIYYSLGVDNDNVNNYKAAKDNYKKYLENVQEDNDYTKYAKTRIEEIN